MDQDKLENKDPLIFLKISRKQRNRMYNMQRQNAFRSFKSQSVINVLAKIEAGNVAGFSILPSYYEALGEEEEDEFAESEIGESLTSTLDQLKGQLNSYRASKIASDVLGIHLDQKKLLVFAKPKDYAYGLSSKAVSALAYENRLAIKKLVIVEHHNLKVTKFPYLQGLYLGQESRLGADFNGLTTDSDIFKDGFCHSQ